MRTAYLYAAATLNRLHSNEISACTASSRPIYASHEALLLNYEEALVRRAPDGRSYLTSGHFVWVGERTRGIDEGHVEFLRGLENPIGVKIGPSTDPETLLGLMNVLDPERIPGHLTLIARLGADKVAEVLPPLLDAALADGRKLVWMSDPMHGNTEALPGGRKTRRLERLVDEARTYLTIHRERGSCDQELQVSHRITSFFELNVENDKSLSVTYLFIHRRSRYRLASVYRLYRVRQHTLMRGKRNKHTGSPGCAVYPSCSQ